MKNRSVTAAELDESIKQHGIVVVDFWAEWCGPCKQFGKVFNQVAEEYEQIAFVNINIEQEQALAEMYGILSIPHLMVFKQGILIYSDSGSMTSSTLKELLDQAIAVDVTDIVAKLNKDKE